MKPRLGTILFLSLSLAALLYGQRLGDLLAPSAAVILCWLGLVGSSLFVHERTPRQDSRRLWSWAQLAIVIGLPVCACPVSYFALVETLMFGGTGLPSVAVILTPMAAVTLATAMALHRARGMLIVGVGGVVVVWLCGRSPRDHPSLALTLWFAMASVSVGQFVSAVAAQTKRTKPSILRQFSSEVWATPKQVRPDVCGKCGHEFAGLEGDSPCPECGTLRPPVQ